MVETSRQLGRLHIQLHQPLGQVEKVGPLTSLQKCAQRGAERLSSERSPAETSALPQIFRVFCSFTRFQAVFPEKPL